MRLRMLALLLTLTLSVLAVGCARSAPDAGTLLSAMLEETRPLPSGACYSLLAAQGEEGYASAELLAALFGEGSAPVALDAVEDGAFYLSFTQPYEIGVFLCKSTGRTREVAEMCLHRLSRLRSYYSARGDESAEGCVRVFGRWVILCFSHDPDAILQAFRRARG